MTSTTIKVTAEVRDRLKVQAAREHRTLGEHLGHLADLADREQRFDALRNAMATTSAEEMSSYAEEVAAWDDLERG
ncbi:MAG: hypothetical protein ACTHNS_03125 [Marmoricola sp.]